MRAAILRAGISQAATAKQLNVSLSTLEDWIAETPRRKAPHKLMQIGALSVLRKRSLANFSDAVIARLGTIPDAELAAELGIQKNEVRQQRIKRNISPAPRRSKWLTEWIALLGTMPDADVALKTGLSLTSVTCKRRELGIKSHSSSISPWTPETLRLLGTMTDADLGQIVGITGSAVRQKREFLKIPALGRNK